MKHLRRRKQRLLPIVFVVTALVTVVAQPWMDSKAQSAPPYSVDFHVISAGGARLRSTCYVLSGTVAEVAPGYSSGGIYSVLAGFLQAATNDGVFTDGFEGCGP